MGIFSGSSVSENEIWVKYRKHENEYNENELLTISTYFDWDIESQEWMNDVKYHNEYDEHNNLILKMNYGWDSEVSNWLIDSKTYYYLRIIKLMYFDEAEDNSAIECRTDMQIALSANGLSVLMLGLFPAALMSICVAAFA